MFQLETMETINIFKVVEMMLNADGAKGQRIKVLLRFIWAHVRFVFQKEFVLNWINGVKIYITKGRRASTECYYYGLFDPEEMSIIRDHTQKGTVFADIGANIGGYSLFAASYGAVVYAFEPAPSTFQLLERNISINPSLSDHIHPLQKVVSESEGEADFTTDLDTVNSMVTREDSKARMSNVIKIPSVTLDGTLDKVNIMKIDVEGFEKSVLGGAKSLLANKDLEIIVLEDPDDEIVAMLSSYGFLPCRYDMKNHKVILLDNIDMKEKRPNGIFIRQ